jgi:lipopolysaccharide biosynthesis regulator YciM
VGLVAEKYLANYRAGNAEIEGLAKLEAHYMLHPSLDLFNSIFLARGRLRTMVDAWAFARHALQRNPSLLGLDRLLEAQLARSSSEPPAVGNVVPCPTGAGDAERSAPLSSEDVALIRSLIHKHTQRLDRYACRACGFKAKRFHWQCPGCNAWETYSPKRLEELDV